jgi:hypothetical protein
MKSPPIAGGLFCVLGTYYLGSLESPIRKRIFLLSEILMRFLVAIVLALGRALGIQAQAPLLPQSDIPLPEFAVATIKPGIFSYIG